MKIKFLFNLPGRKFSPGKVVANKDGTHTKLNDLDEEILTALAWSSLMLPI